MRNSLIRCSRQRDFPLRPPGQPAEPDRQNPQAQVKFIINSQPEPRMGPKLARRRRGNDGGLTEKGYRNQLAGILSNQV